MHKNELLDFRVAHCGGCGLQIHFWPRDGARVTCVNCGLDHEVECDSALNLSSGEKTDVAMLVAVWSVKTDGQVDVRLN